MNIGILSGHLTADATFTPGTDQSKNRAKFKLAVSDSYDKNLVSFYTCIAFGPKANYIGNGLQKGRFLKGCEARVEGRLNSKDFTDENGVKHTYQELTINEIESSVHKAWFENQNQQNVPNSGNNQGQQAYNGPAAPAGRSQGGQGSYYGSPQQNYNNPQGGQGSQYGTPQSNGQSYNGPQGGQDLYYGSPRGNGQNNNSQNYNGPQRGQDSHYGSPQGNGQNQYTIVHREVRTLVLLELLEVLQVIFHVQEVRHLFQMLFLQLLILFQEMDRDQMLMVVVSILQNLEVIKPDFGKELSGSFLFLLFFCKNYILKKKRKE